MTRGRRACVECGEAVMPVLLPGRSRPQCPVCGYSFP